jgi:hypothetical protein
VYHRMQQQPARHHWHYFLASTLLTDMGGELAEEADHRLRGDRSGGVPAIGESSVVQDGESDAESPRARVGFAASRRRRIPS